MGRKIDFSKPLTADEAAYVADRPWLRTDAELQGFEVTLEDDEFILEDGAQPDDTSSDGSGEDTGEGEDVGEGSDDEDGEDEAEPYDVWAYADLKAEAKSRGISASGSKEQLVERLNENDGEAE